MNGENKFPTIGLKSLLQNSDLLDMLLKPLKPQKDTTNETNTSVNSNNKKLITDDLITSNLSSVGINDTDSDSILAKGLFDWELESKESKLLDASETNDSKIYGNAYLGQNLWGKNDLLQDEKLGLKFETLDYLDFLSENNLNESDVEFLDKLQKTENSNVIKNAVKTTDSIVSNQQNTNIVSTQSLPQSKLVSSLTLSPSSTTASQPSIFSPSSSYHEMSPTSSNSKKVSIPNCDWNLDTNELSLDSDSFSEDYESSLNNTDTVKMFQMGKKSQKTNSSFNQNNKLEMNGLETHNQMDNETEDDFNLEISTDVGLNHQFVPSDLKDEKYWSRRRKNNLAAKRSRDTRRMKENQIAIRANFLERENDTLKKQLEDSKRETRLLKIKLSRYESLNPNPELK